MVAKKIINLELRTGSRLRKPGAFKEAVLSLFDVFDRDPAVIAYIRKRIRRQYKEYSEWYDKIIVLL